MELGETARTLFQRIRRRIPVEMGNYPYVTARVKAKKALLLKPEVYDRLLQMSIPGIARFLGEGQYSEEMVALGTRYDGVDLVEMATRDNLAKVFTQIIEFSEGPLQEMIAGFLDRWDVWNIKTVLRGKFYGAPASEIAEDVVPAGSLSRSFLESLAEMEELEEIITALQDTPYGHLLVGLPASLETLPSLAPYEDLLDKVFYENLLAAVPPATEPTKLFHNFVRSEIDVVNLKTLLRTRGLDAVEERQIFIGGGRTFTVDELRELAGLEWPALLERLRDAPFHEVLVPHLQEDPPRLDRGVRALERWYLQQAGRGANLHPLSVIPVLSYVIGKTTEVENLRIIARGKAAGLETDRIRELLVI